ncbi:hypothetical protein PCC7424_4685 [Gloeothece citriformis PCC 7424]|uniref:Uncharacterized protein n=1 Tax=Gloeothece citriformis (strain PCC 7424) TaxID=65393 RepID=B7KBR7_GLOC7|nr:hypothetical protein [Gloeothece citriformis]ACK73045.1 hypothetical protein PCC7424_4685 [Gloeothece citriformis PCC 7424]
MSEKIASTLYLLSKLPALKSKRTKLSNWSDFYFKYQSKLYLLILSFMIMITIICFANNNNIYFMIFWLISYLLYNLFFLVCSVILGKEKTLRDIPINILTNTANHLKVDIDLKLIEENINSLNFYHKDQLSEYLANNKNITIDILEVFINYFNNKLNSLNSIQRKINLFGNPVITLIITILLGLLGSNLILDFQVLSTSIKNIIIILFPCIIFAYYSFIPSQTEKVYQEILSVLKKAREQKKNKGIVGKFFDFWSKKLSS